MVRASALRVFDPPAIRLVAPRRTTDKLHAGHALELGPVARMRRTWIGKPTGDGSGPENRRASRGAFRVQLSVYPHWQGRIAAECSRLESDRV